MARTRKASRRPASTRAPRRLETLKTGKVDNLKKIDHIVVLMLENRSFDHMLGYLTLESGRADIDGLKTDMSNTHNGTRYRVNHLTRRVLTKEEDPAHGGSSIAAQIANNNSGFVTNYANDRPDAPDLKVVMGYYNADDLPVYDHLAAQYCVCDRWFSSTPGATWPNRLYAATGKAAGSKDGKKVPIYDLPAFIRHLQSKRVSWHWYAHDISTLRVVDSKYRIGEYSHFSYFDRNSMLSKTNFFDHARSGKLAAVSWIDPNFVDFNYFGPSGSNDDHPPSDVMAGQDLVFKVYNALIRSPSWKKSMLVITYDEHGGFYDHVHPPAAEDERPAFRQYGVRVPALVISPWADPGSVSKVEFDHTSIIKTILLRFCQGADGKIPNMGARVQHANHLGHILTRTTARAPEPITAYQHVIDRIAEWRAEVVRKQLTEKELAPAAQPDELHDLQKEVVEAKRRLRAAGLPEGQP